MINQVNFTSINNLKFYNKFLYTFIQLLVLQGFEIPRFCYSESLYIAGNCRMCLIELLQSLKLLVSCAVSVFNTNLILYTNTVKVKWVREAIIELLLINHPLDCPICDQGGECDLQDQTLIYGSDRGRYYEYKRAVTNKNLGIYIKTSMNRCIHCTRCIRFTNNLEGFSSLGLLGRGNRIEIGTYLKTFNSEHDVLLTNIVDLCPVGALTLKISAFKSRLWELEQYDSFDITDSMLSSTRIDIQNNIIIRILPRINKYLNDNWLTNKARFLFFNMQQNKLDTPYININNQLIQTNWIDIYFYFKKYLLQRINQNFQTNFYSLILLILSGKQSDVITNYMLKIFSILFGFLNFINVKIKKTIKKFIVDFRNQYIFTERIKDVLKIKKQKILIFFDVNLRGDLPLLNLQIRRFTIKHRINYSIINFSQNHYTNLPQIVVGNPIYSFLNNMSACNWISTHFKTKNISIIIGSTLIQNINILNLLNRWKFFFIFNEKKNITFQILNIDTNKINLSELGFINGIHQFTSLQKLKKKKLNILLYSINDKLPKHKFIKNQFQIFQNNQLLSKNMFLPNLILINKNFFENISLFFNLEGKLRKSPILITAPLLARSDWQIIYTLIEYFNFITYFSHINYKIITKLLTNILNCIEKTSPFIKIHEKRNFNLQINNNNIQINPIYFYKQKFKLIKIENLLLYKKKMTIQVKNLIKKRNNFNILIKKLLKKNTCITTNAILI